MRVDELHRFLRIARPLHAMACLLQGVGDQLLHSGIVFDDQDSGGHRFEVAMSARRI